MTGKANPEGYKVFRSVAKTLTKEGTPFSLNALAKWCGINRQVARVVRDQGLLKSTKLIVEATKLSNPK